MTSKTIGSSWQVFALTTKKSSYEWSLQLPHRRVSILVLKNCCLFIQEFFSQKKKGSKLNFHKMNISIFYLFENRCYSTMILSNLHPHFGCFLSQCFGLFTLRPSSGVCHIWYLSRNVEYSSKVGILFSFFDFCLI